MTSETILEVRALQRSFADREVLGGLDFDLFRGECLVVVGRSGIGKSVLLRHLNGLESPDAGSVFFDGVDLARLSERELFAVRRRIAMLFQSGALFDSLTVFENVAFPLRAHTDLNEDGVAEAVAAKLAMVRLSGIEEKVPADLSGGMKKRVALARSLALDPQVMLYDEPTTGLDPVTATAIGQLLVRTQERLGMSSVVVTHDLRLARQVGDRVAFLHDRRFRFLGTWEEAREATDPVFQDFLNGKAEVDDAI